ncbi:hypothetical protein A3860_29760 [Niastella vici]|uniref:Uncharacterized protein n=1 Tax=Niastella vici TaxID=1703345 RepID=A0A1V9FUZ4_9BACT|nr:hypothetical protein [Niastella vici]OQP62137.1 hypothetical protein A3860_29760 [Niastella vici]
MSLFKTGDATYDKYAAYSTEQLVQIVTDTSGNYQPGVVDTARRILLARGFDYRTKEQKAAEKQLKAINATRERTSTTTTAAATTAFSRRQVRGQSRPANNSGLKAWHWIWIAFIIIRMIGCLMRHG